MSQRPPPFENFVFLGELAETMDQLRPKILSGEIKTFIYSSEAKGDFEPVPISPAAFSIAEEAGRDEEGQPDPQLKPFQIMAHDLDRRRLSGTRRRIAVPHWLYAVRAPALNVDQQSEAGPARNGSGVRTTKHATAEEACGVWISLLPEEPRQRKADIKRAALTKHLGLSENAFERQWALYAPASWKAQGRF